MCMIQLKSITGKNNFTIVVGEMQNRIKNSTAFIRYAGVFLRFYIRLRLTPVNLGHLTYYGVVQRFRDNRRNHIYDQNPCHHTARQCPNRAARQIAREDYYNHERAAEQASAIVQIRKMSQLGI